jgi:flagellar biosynthetic protein FliR
MITVTSAELNTWIAMLLWPLARILGLLAIAPLFGNISIPARVKIGLAIMLALAIAPTVPALPATDPASLPGLLILLQQMLIGVAMGFVMRVVFAAIEMAGEIASLTMGLGFATFFDPMTRASLSGLSQLMTLLALMLYLATNLHLVTLAILAESFNILPIGASITNGQGWLGVANWGAIIFSAGVQLSLPIVAVLLAANLALGILTRAAPQLNLFGIGFPIMLGVGFIMLAITIPYLATPLANLFQEGVTRMMETAASLR